MEEEYSLGTSVLAQNLGFIRDALPYQFNQHRHQEGLTAWDQSFETSASKLSPLSLHWHQLAAVHSIARRSFSKEPDTLPRGTLICDEVGLGKTTLAIAVGAFLNQLISIQDSDIKPPPLIRTLRQQWIHELKVLYRPKSVDILVYDCPKSGNQSFWSPSGPFHCSRHQLQNRIIVTTHSNEYLHVYGSTPSAASASKTPWELPDPRRPTKDTLFGQSYLTVIIDEAHEFRNVGLKYYGGLTIMKKALIKLVLTATPLLTSPKDLLGLARIIGIPHFLTEASVLESREDAAALRRAKKVEDDGNTVQDMQISIVRRIQTQFHGYVLRRTGCSLDNAGKTLLNLPPYKQIVGILSLTDRENEILNQHAEDAKANVIAGNDTGKFLTQKFYMEYRLNVAFAKTDPAAPNPKFETIEQWEKVKSTKMDT
ncbi:P-loop containing nucleoside triphosphate hydrolase protein, partial [Lentinula raphanica]